MAPPRTTIQVLRRHQFTQYMRMGHSSFAHSQQASLERLRHRENQYRAGINPDIDADGFVNLSGRISREPSFALRGGVLTAIPYQYSPEETLEYLAPHESHARNLLARGKIDEAIAYLRKEASFAYGRMACVTAPRPDTCRRGVTNVVHASGTIAWLNEATRELATMRIAAIDRTLATTTDAATKRKLQKELAAVRAGMALANSLPKGTFVFGDARLVASVARAQLIIGFMIDDGALVEQGMKTRKRLLEAEKQNKAAQFLIKQYLSFVPHHHQHAARSEYAPRGTIVAKAFRALRNESPERAATFARVLHLLMRSDKGFFNDADAFMRASKEWIVKAKTINKDNAIQHFFAKLAAQIKRSAPASEKLGVSAARLDGIIADLSKLRRPLSMVKLQGLKKEIAKMDVDITDVLLYDKTNLHDRTPLSIKALLAYARVVRGRVLAKLDHELHKEVNASFKKLTINAVHSAQVRGYIQLVTRDKVPTGGRAKAIERLNRLIQRAIGYAFTSAIIKALRVYRKADRAQTVCNDDLGFFTWAGCTLGASFFGNGTLEYDDTGWGAYGPMIARLERIKAELRVDGREWHDGWREPLARLAGIQGGKQLAYLHNQGKRDVDDFQFQQLLNAAATLVASLLIGNWAGSAARAATLARLAKGASDTARLVRAARIAMAVRAVTSGVVVAQLEMGLADNTWGGYDFRNNKWAVRKTLEKTAWYIALFGTLEGVAAGYGRAASWYANARGIDLKTLGRLGRLVHAGGKMASEFTALTALDGTHSVYKNWKTNGSLDLAAFNKAFEWENMMDRAILVLAFQIDGAIMKPMRSRAGDKSFSLKMALHKRVLEKLTRALKRAKDALRGAGRGGAGAKIEALKATRNALLVAATFMTTTGAFTEAESERPAQLADAIDTLIQKHEILGGTGNVAGVKKVGNGRYTYFLSAKETLVDHLNYLGATPRGLDGNRIIVTLNGMTYIFSPSRT